MLSLKFYCHLKTASTDTLLAPFQFNTTADCLTLFSSFPGVVVTQIQSLLPSPFNYSIIGIPEVLQFTVRLLEGKIHTHTHTCLFSLLVIDILTSCQSHTHNTQCWFSFPTHSRCHSLTQTHKACRRVRYWFKVRFQQVSCHSHFELLSCQVFTLW